MRDRFLARLPSVLSRAVPAAFFVIVCVGFYRSYLATGRLTALFWMVSEGLVVVLLVFRRDAARVSRSGFDWFVALLGAFAVLLVRPSPRTVIPDAAGVALQFIGSAFEVYGKAVLGRSFGIVPANRGIVLRGPYRIVRHPIYLGYLVTHVGFLLSNFSPRNLAVYAVAYAFQILRIRSEERILSEDAGYREYCGRVRYRLVPGLY